MLSQVGEVAARLAQERGERQRSYFESVRALDFLHPPWGLAFDQLFTRGLAATR